MGKENTIDFLTETQAKFKTACVEGDIATVEKLLSPEYQKQYKDLKINLEKDIVNHSITIAGLQSGLTPLDLANHFKYSKITKLLEEQGARSGREQLHQYFKDGYNPEESKIPNFVGNELFPKLKPLLIKEFKAWQIERNKIISNSKEKIVGACVNGTVSDIEKVLNTNKALYKKYNISVQNIINATPLETNPTKIKLLDIANWYNNTSISNWLVGHGAKSGKAELYKQFEDGQNPIDWGRGDKDKHCNMVRGIELEEYRTLPQVNNLNNILSVLPSNKYKEFAFNSKGTQGNPVAHFRATFDKSMEKEVGTLAKLLNDAGIKTVMGSKGNNLILDVQDGEPSTSLKARTSIEQNVTDSVSKHFGKQLESIHRQAPRNKADKEAQGNKHLVAVLRKRSSGGEREPS
jgi:hypothetical protein